MSCAAFSLLSCSTAGTFLYCMAVCRRPAMARAPMDCTAGCLKSRAIALLLCCSTAVRTTNATLQGGRRHNRVTMLAMVSRCIALLDCCIYMPKDHSKHTPTLKVHVVVDKKPGPLHTNLKHTRRTQLQHTTTWADKHHAHCLHNIPQPILPSVIHVAHLRPLEQPL